ncbi:MAG: hypothetical protein BGO82_18660 [Devosia sp. 67-54]|uniref:BrnT family toxin n=1 Tax=unclassified Devosia TaxID=196773 RepID=UPI0009661697|nr:MULTISPECIES: BrnT family toxin [unclassified Devosia]MBN9304398.1 BrnT family toxin [Devosia sp.]OJX18199.1 MAG: hypothetical protein BGO82_18660 [Devosia sp. 67-54]
MDITFDPVKRNKTLRERKLDFLRAVEIFEGPNYRFVDDRFDYGEERIVTIGYLDERMMVVVWTPRGAARHVISMRKANDREKVRYGKFLD